MPLAVQVQCPAKVNLFLEVTGRRPDGYHTLATLFAKISLFDVIDAEIQDKGLSLDIVNQVGSPLPAGPDNLVYRAAEAFRRCFRIGLGSRLRLTKRIPMGAGLGGGSSDAAGAMKALVRLYGMERQLGLTARLRRLAVGLGADVPLFLRDEGLTRGRGIGERLAPLSAAKALPWMILAFPGISVPTKDVFGGFRLSRREGILTSLSHLYKLEKKLEKGCAISEWEGLLFNRLEADVAAAFPEVRQALGILRRLGLRGVMMSGSGSSVFGFAPSHAEGEKALKRLKGYPWKVFLVSCLG